jgi:hypothetical protein
MSREVRRGNRRQKNVVCFHWYINRVHGDLVVSRYIRVITPEIIIQLLYLARTQYLSIVNLTKATEQVLRCLELFVALTC